MKRFLKIWTIALVTALSFASCEKKEGNPTDESGAPANNLKTGEVQIRVRTSSSKKVSFEATTQSLTIDWGDGTVEPLPGSIKGKYEHAYSHDAVVNIKLQTTALTYFKTGEGGYCPDPYYLDDEICQNANWRIVFGACDLTTFEGHCSYLDLSKCPKLTDFGNSSYSVADSLNLANCAMIKKVYIGYTRWLNVKGCTALEELAITSGMLLSSLDVSTCTALRRLECRGYETRDDDKHVGLTSLDVSKNTKLEYLDCANNLFDAAALNAIFQGLPTLQGNSNSSDYYYGMCDVSNNPGTVTCNKSLAEKKEWTVRAAVGSCQLCTVTITEYNGGAAGANSEMYPSGEYCGEQLTAVKAANGADVVGADEAKGGKYVVICE